MFIPYRNDVYSIYSFMNVVFPRYSQLSKKLVVNDESNYLTLKTHSVYEINVMIIQRILGEIKQYYSFDGTINTSEQDNMGDFLNILTPNGLPPVSCCLRRIAPSCC